MSQDHEGLLELERAMVRGDVAAMREAVLRLDEEGRQRLAAEIGTGAVATLRSRARRRRRARRGRVVVTHGIMGSNLEVVDPKGDADLVWVNYWRLLRGRMEDLRLELDGQPSDPDLSVRTAGFHKSYLPLIMELDREWEVLPFAYDWRRDIDESAQDLAERVDAWRGDEPAHLVAHSMGGLVCRRMIQLAPATWQGLADEGGLRRGGRLVMLGTPNRGSFAISLMLTGEEKLVKYLAALDFSHDLDELLEIVATFRGGYQMMPSPRLDLGDDHQSLAHPASWGRAPIVAQHLAAGLRFQEELWPVTDPARLLYVAGYDQETPDRIRIESPGRFEYRVSRDGDGRVAHTMGLLPGVRTFWVDQSHGDLPKDQAVLDSIHDVLHAGEPGRLLPRKPAGRRAAPRWVPAGELVPLEEVVAFTSQVARQRRSPRTLEEQQRALRLEAALVDEWVGGGAFEVRALGRDREPRHVKLAVEVVWGDITREKAQVYCVGHYVGVAPQNAERALDGIISGRDRDPDHGVLATLTRRGILRGELGQVEFFPLAEGEGVVAVAGMGHPGTFGEPQLRKLANSLVWSVGSHPRSRTVCSVLIGSGVGGLDIEAALEGLLRGAAEAVQAGLQGSVKELRIVELDRTRAEDILAALLVLRDRLGDQLEIVTSGRLVSGRHFDRDAGREVDGGWFSRAHAYGLALQALARAAVSGRQTATSKAVTRVLTRADGAHRGRVREELLELGRALEEGDAPPLRIALEDGPARSDLAPARLSFVRDGEEVVVAGIDNSAVVRQRRLRKDYTLIRDAICEACDPEAEAAARLGRILKGLLLPPELEAIWTGSGSVILEVDRELAAVPWELVGFDEDGTHIGLAVELARQLRTEYVAPPAPTAAFGQHRRALVIGDPGDPELGEDLPGARAEAIKVARILRRHGLEVILRLGAPGAAGFLPAEGESEAPASRLEILDLLRGEPFDLLHYSGHGDFDPESPSRAGWVFKGGMITAAELEGIDQLPQLVVANACLSARTSQRTRDGAEAPLGSAEAVLAASMADELLRRGVRNFVGTAWEVDDAGAEFLAETLYDRFLGEGKRLGEALLEARLALHARRDEFGCLWAAYQHFGDPALRAGSP